MFGFKVSQPSSDIPVCVVNVTALLKTPGIAVVYSRKFLPEDQRGCVLISSGRWGHGLRKT